MAVRSRESAMRCVIVCLALDRLPGFGRKKSAVTTLPNAAPTTTVAAKFHSAAVL